MPRAKKQNDDAVLYKTLFTLVEEKGWHALTLPLLARALKIKTATLIQHYADKNALLLGFRKYLDETVLAQAEETEAPLKEKLFDLLMARFDVLQDMRGGVTRLMGEIFLRPISAAFLGFEAGPQMCCSMRRMLEVAGVPSGTPQSLLLSVGLKLVYINALRVWKNDGSADMAATMAALDRGLENLLRLTPSKA